MQVSKLRRLGSPTQETQFDVRVLLVDGAPNLRDHLQRLAEAPNVLMWSDSEVANHGCRLVQEAAGLLEKTFQALR